MKWDADAEIGRASERKVAERLDDLDGSWRRWGHVYLEAGQPGGDIDFVLDGPQGLIAIEVKSSAKDLDTKILQAARVAERVARQIGVEVAAILCVPGQHGSDRHELDGRTVWLVGLAQLLELLPRVGAGPLNEDGRARLTRAMPHEPGKTTMIARALYGALLDDPARWWATGPVFPTDSYRIEFVAVGLPGLLAIRSFDGHPKVKQLEKSRSYAEDVKAALGTDLSVGAAVVLRRQPDLAPRIERDVHVLGASHLKGWLASLEGGRVSALDIAWLHAQRPIRRRAR